MRVTSLIAWIVTPRAVDSVTFECASKDNSDDLAISGVDARTVTCTMMLAAVTVSSMSDGETPSSVSASFLLNERLLDSSKESSVLDNVSEKRTSEARAIGGGGEGGGGDGGGGNGSPLEVAAPHWLGFQAHIEHCPMIWLDTL